MIEQELAGTEDAPVQVLQEFPAVFRRRFLPEFFDALVFPFGRFSAEGGEVKFLGDFLEFVFFGDVFRDLVFLAFQFAVERFAIHDVQHLRHARLIGAFAFAGNQSIRTPKGFQEIRIQRDIRELHGPCAFFFVLEPGWGGGDL